MRSRCPVAGRASPRHYRASPTRYKDHDTTTKGSAAHARRPSANESTARTGRVTPLAMQAARRSADETVLWLDTGTAITRDATGTN